MLTLGSSLKRIQAAVNPATAWGQAARPYLVRGAVKQHIDGAERIRQLGADQLGCRCGDHDHLGVGASSFQLKVSIILRDVGFRGFQGLCRVGLGAI